MKLTKKQEKKLFNHLYELKPSITEQLHEDFAQNLKQQAAKHRKENGLKQNNE